MAPRRPDGEAFRVLVVGADSLTTGAAERLLESLGYSARGATSAAQAMQAGGEWRPDLVVCDRVVGESDGLALLRQLRGRLPRVLSVLALGRGETAGESESDRELFFAVLRKPVAPGDLARNVGAAARAALQRWQEERRAAGDEGEAIAAAVRKARFEAWHALSRRMAHRIQNQLFPAQGAVRRLKQDPTDKTAAADLEACLDRVRRISQEFQAYSGRALTALRPMSLGPLVAEVVRRYRQSAPELQWSCDLADDLPLSAVDPGRMEEALGELLENAIRHSPGGGSVRVTLARAEEGPPRVRLTVADTGTGVEEQDKERIFEPFVHLRPDSSGLGLALVKRTVENHGGTICERGTPGKGAEFVIELPALPAKESGRP